jgi:hypothetical protein
LLEIERNLVCIGERRRPQPEAQLHRLDQVQAVAHEDAQVGHDLEVAVERLVDVRGQLLKNSGQVAVLVFRVTFALN